MKRVSNAYKQAMNKIIRDHSQMIITIGIVSNEAQATAEVVSTSNYLSDNKSLFNNNGVTNVYATLEENVFKCDGSMIIPPEDVEYAQLINNIGYLSNTVSSGIRVSFNKAYDIKGLTINFGEYYPTSFRVVLNDTTEYTYSNDSNMFETEDSFNDATVIEVIPLAFANGDMKRLRIESMLMGVGIVFRNDDIENASYNESSSFISEELPQIDFSVSCFDKYKRFNVDDSNSYINYLEVGQEISSSVGIELEDGTYEWVDLPLTYLSTWASDSNRITFSSVDRFAFLTAKYTEGNTIHTRTLYQDAIAVLTFAGFEPDEYLIADYLKTITVTNPLPEVSCAECLQLIANAGKCALKQDSDGRIIMITNFENIVEPTDISIESDTHATWSHPSNVNVGASFIYADMTRDFMPLDGSTFFLPDNNTSYLETGYVSKQIADSNGNFFDNLLPTPYGGTRTQAGITFTYNSDGSVHAKGTATANTWYYFHSNGGMNPWMVADCPWELGDVLQCDYWVRGSANGTIGIAWGYKSASSSSSLGYIVYRNHHFGMTDSAVKLSDIKRQTIDPAERIGQYLTAYIFVEKNCVIDATIYPVLTKRTKLNNLLSGSYYRFMQNAVNNVYVKNGITYTLNSDGSILVNGTATAESALEIVNPFANNYRFTLELNHTYKLSEGRENITTLHNNPYLQFVRYNTDTATYDYNVNTAYGDKTFTANDDKLLGYGVRIVVGNGKTVDNVILRPSLIDVDDYDETEIVPTNYVAGKKPSITLRMPTTYTYFSVDCVFGGNLPQEMTITTYNNDELLDQVHVDTITENTHVNYDFYDFNRMRFDFTKGSPNDRVILQKVTFGDLTNYKLTTQNMMQMPTGIVEPKTKSMNIKVFTFENVEGEPKKVDDNVYYTYNMGSVGEDVTYENQLIGNQEHAQEIAKWLANYYLNNITYTVNYRGEPRIESLDYIFMESDVLNNLQVEVEELTLNFNGALSGALKLRRAFNIVGE